ncbi:hypothetical protein O181_011363 [Austropuccinia psidii MF-1]|uniref:Uncharacterized protein n=1 Tax=Austropuccinia psidii MF-1 TaxID=1389203 RepID=A0A9Q3BUQ1_9BASI|nr:hypothetical protein [Austropuccinia psidii MF-1]
MPGELEHSVKCRCNPDCALDDIANTLQDVRKRTNTRKYTPYRSIGFKEKQPFRVKFKDNPRARVAEVEKKKNSCHKWGSKYNYGKNCPKEKKKSMPLSKSQRRNPPKRILTQNLWIMPSENNLIVTKTQEKNS